jgi:hypothetical protein
MKVAKYTTVAGATLFVTLEAQSDRRAEILERGSGRKNVPVKQRAPKQDPTPDEMVALNERNSEKNMAMIVNSNFGEGDYHFVHTYTGKIPSVEEAEKNISAHKRRLSALYKKEGVPLRWVEVTEYRKARIHHHIICSGGVDVAKIRALWKNGYNYIVFFDGTGNYRNLTKYLFKEMSRRSDDSDRKVRRKYNCSRSVVRPANPKREYVLASNLLDEPKPPAGYHLDKDSLYRGVNPFTNMPYVEYVMVANNPEVYWIKKWRRGKTVKSKQAREQARFNAWLRKNGYEQMKFIFEDG